MQTLLHFFAGMYDAGGVERPEWLQLGFDRYVDDEGEELPVDVMLDVIDASVLNIPESTGRRHGTPSLSTMRPCIGAAGCRCPNGCAWDWPVRRPPCKGQNFREVGGY